MLGALDMFAIGIGPSSSHTIGPMKAALQFVTLLDTQGLLNRVKRLKVHLYGSLALTGEGHGTVLAVLNGLSGENPRSVDPDSFIPRASAIKANNSINLLNAKPIEFIFTEDLILHKDEFLIEHANGMQFIAYDHDMQILLQKKYFSVGGGFILDEGEIKAITETANNNGEDIKIPYPFKTATELFALCKEHKLTIAQLVLKNELGRKTEAEVKQEALEIIQTMHESVIKGVTTEGVLPGILGVRRRAADLYKKLSTANTDESVSIQNQRLLAMAYAIAVNEENAAFSRIVTAPTNGSAGTIPGVLEYYRNFCSGATEDKLIEFILTAGAIGMLYKFGASISAAEVGCQGEIGVACSMAAAALTAVLGGNLTQIEKAAEIAMEHHLGMTCDPISGLVQIPCIERNGIAASKAIDIARLALLEELPGMISLDGVIKTMLQTGKDMSMKYKETALGGLAVNVVNC